MFHSNVATNYPPADLIAIEKARNKGKKRTSYVPCLSIGLLIALVGCVLHIFGTALAKWESNDFYDMGLFDICYKDKNVCEDISDLSDKQKLTQALALVGVSFGLLGILGVTAFTLIALLGRAARRSFVFGSAFCCIVAFLFSGACVLYWVFKVHDDDSNDLDTSFYLSAVGSGLLAIGGLLILASAKCVPSYRKPNRPV